MLRIFRPRHIMWKYWMFPASEAIARGGLCFWGYSEREGSAENESIFAYVAWIMTATKQFLIKTVFFRSRETITGWKQWIKILQQQKITESGKINCKKLSNFSCCPLHDADHCYLFFALWIFNWLFMRIYTIKPFSGASSEWMPTIIMSLTININALCIHSPCEKKN